MSENQHMMYRPVCWWKKERLAHQWDLGSDWTEAYSKACRQYRRISFKS